MSELKPCPFCGGEANTQIFDKVLNVGCPRCDIRTRFMLHDELEYAIEAWNKRYMETCRLIEYGSLANIPTFVCWSCSECGFGWHHSINDKQFSYCPNCGRKIGL